MKLGILQTGHVPEQVATSVGDYTALYAAMFPGRGYETATFSVVDDAWPTGPLDADAWLITGSRHGAYEDHPWIAPLEALIRAIRDSGRPLVGVCFGHQIIAQALGGTVEKYQGGWQIGRQSYNVAGQPLSLNAWHQDQVVALPAGAKRLGHTDQCENAIVAYGDRILAVQPHPEFGDEVVDLLLQYRSDTVPAPLKDAARRSLGQADDNARIHAWIAAVLEGTAPADAVPFATADEL